MDDVLSGIQNTNPKDSGYEHVALVTFGGETRVQQHLTTQYFELLTKLGMNCLLYLS